MTKNLSQRIAERAQLKKAAATSRNKVAFLALQKDIREALDDGWSIKDVWATLFEEQKISFSYKTFRLYVNQFIPSSIKQDSAIMADKKGSSEKKPAVIPPKPQGFVFNPKARAEDLL